MQNSNSGARYLPTKEDVLSDLAGRVKEGDLVLTMGAGDIWKVGAALADSIKSKK